MAFHTSVVPMDNVVIIHLYPRDQDCGDVQSLRKKATELFNEKTGFTPDKGAEWSSKEWKQYDSFILWLTESWEQAEKDYYPSNGAFVVTNRRTGHAVVFLLDLSTFHDSGQVTGMHSYYEINS